MKPLFDSMLNIIIPPLKYKHKYYNNTTQI